MTSPIVDLFSDLGNAFHQTSSEWYVFGAQAAIIHGASRLTADVDVTVMYGDAPIEDLIGVLEDKGFEIRVKEAAAFIHNARVLPVLHLKSGIPVDIVFGGPGLEEEFVQRALQYDIEGVKVPVASGEDIIAMKILSGREKDLDDAMAIMTAQHEQLNLRQIRTTLEILESALDRSDLLSVLDGLIDRV